MNRLLFALATFAASFSVVTGAPNSSPQTSRFPAPLLDRVSSGGLWRLDDNGDLVTAPQNGAAQQQTTSSEKEIALAVTLDPRVGKNVRLGADPPKLPSGQRAQAEPHIMRSRSNLDLLVATFQEGRFTNGGALDCGFSATRNGGLTWSRGLLPGVTKLTGGSYFRATDPVVGFDLSNTVFINMDAATDSAFNHGDVIVSRSGDAGATFQPPVLVYHPTNTNYFADKNWMAVNTFGNTPSAGRVYVTWTLFTNFTSSSSTSPLMASYSDDGGVHWSPAQFITPLNSYLQGSQPLFLPNGRLAVVYWNFTQPTIPNAGEHIEVIVSDNGGATFGPPIHVTGPVKEWFEPSIRSGTFLPSATTDRTTNSIYVVYQANLGTDSAPLPKILFVKSKDGGATWSTPKVISNNPGGSGVFNPAISASPDGKTLTVAFYDHRATHSATRVDMFEAQSFDGGATWQPNIRISSVSSDVTVAPNTGTSQNPSYMLGDYLGIADPANVHVPAVPVWVDTRTGNPDPFVTRIGVAPHFNFASWQAARLSLAEIEAPQGGLKPLNISTRARVGLGENALIGGFIVTGPAGSTKRVLIRGLGPSLGALGVPNSLPDPLLILHYPNRPAATNDNWQSGSNARQIPAALRPHDTRESAMLVTLPASPAGTHYTAELKGAHGETGIGLVEAYDLSEASAPQFANISTRGAVGTGDAVMIGGFIIGGGTARNGIGSAKVVVRAIGPSLAKFGVKQPLQDPTLELHDVNGTAIFFDDNWKDKQAAAINATGLAPTDSRESALVALVPPGNYTAIVRGKNDSTGVALVEAYNVQ